MGEGMMGGGMMAEGGRGAAMAKPLPERLAMHTQMMERHLGTAKKLQLAVQPLYTQLDAKQRKNRRRDHADDAHDAGAIINNPAST